MWNFDLELNNVFFIIDQQNTLWNYQKLTLLTPDHVMAHLKARPQAITVKKPFKKINSKMVSFS